MKHSIRRNFTFIFIALVSVLVLVMYIMYSYFLTRYYRQQKINTLKAAYVTLSGEVDSAVANGDTLLNILHQDYDQNAEDSSVISMFRDLSERSNIDIVMLDSSGTLMAATSRESEWNALKLRAYTSFKAVYGDDVALTFPIGNANDAPEHESASSAESTAATETAESPESTESTAGESAAESRSGNPQSESAGNTGSNRQDSSKKPPVPSIEVISQNDEYTLQFFNDHRSDSMYLECWGTFEADGSSFLMSMPIASIEEGVDISKKFLAAISIVILIVGAVAVYITTGYITKPINELAHISERMSELDFSARYTGKSKNEIGVLGESMNTMSEKLETAINELKEANAKLQEDIDAKIKIDEMRKEFIADVSHELKTPISIIEGYAEGLVEGMAEDKETREYYCGVIMDESSKMAKMVKQLTSLITYEFGNEVNDCTRFDLSELVKSVTDASHMRLDDAGARLELDINTNGPAYVYADEFKIEEAFTNYLNNAMNHLEGDKNIKVSLYPEDDSWKLSVYNDGKNIPEESIERIWEKFYKVDKSRSRQYGGSGIGLSIVKAVIDSHGGKYGAVNKDNGVEFYFSLPKNT